MGSKGIFCKDAKNEITGAKSIFQMKTIDIKVEEKLRYTNILHFSCSEGIGGSETVLYSSSDFYD